METKGFVDIVCRNQLSPDTGFTREPSTTIEKLLPYVLTIGKRKPARVRDLCDASSTYQEMRERSGLGSSRFHDGIVTLDGVEVARVSYNGRVWPPGEWKVGSVPLLEAQ